MHSGFEIPGIHHHPPPQQQQQQQQQSDNQLLLSMNPTHILDQIHSQQHLPPLDSHFHHRHHFHGGAAAYFPLNFKLGLGGGGGGGDANLLRGSEHYELPEARQSSLGMLQSHFWEPLQAEASNENSELRQREALATCLDAKSRVHFSELEAIYKRLGNSESNQTRPDETEIETVTASPATAHHHLPSAAAEEATATAAAKSKRRRKKKAAESRDPQLIGSMAEFFENLVKQVMDHQENLQKKFTEVIDRLGEERRAREETWRSQEAAQLEREAAARQHEKAMARSREAMIVAYLEKITGQRINLPPSAASEITAANTSDDSNCGGEDDRS